MLCRGADAVLDTVDLILDLSLREEMDGWYGICREVGLVAFASCDVYVLWWHQSEFIDR